MNILICDSVPSTADLASVNYGMVIVKEGNSFFVARNDVGDCPANVPYALLTDVIRRPAGKLVIPAPVWQ